jgi:hypothetical protein
MGVPTMAQAKTFVALDVHVSKTVAAIIDRDSGELTRQRLSGRASEIPQVVSGLQGPVRATYEACTTRSNPRERRRFELIRNRRTVL